MNSSKKVGRPSNDEDNRGKLLRAAKKSFLLYDYDKVSIRAIAFQAGVDSALIRYYFQSKLGLFSAMVKETVAPVTAQLHKLPKSIDAQSANQLMATYYEVMSHNPELPKLIFKISSMPETNQNQILKKILTDILAPKNIKLFSLMEQQGVLQKGVDPLCMQISFFSMMIFPFLMPDFFKAAFNINITPEFMTHLALQNNHLLQHGCLNTKPVKEIL